MIALDRSFLVKEGDKVSILGIQYTALKVHFIAGIDFNKGTIVIWSKDVDEDYSAKNYTYKELVESGLIEIEETQP